MQILCLFEINTSLSHFIAIMEVIIESHRSRLLRLARARKQRWRDSLDQEYRDRLREQNRLTVARRRQQETLEETQARRRANALRISLRRQREAQMRHEAAANYQLIVESLVSQVVQDKSWFQQKNFHKEHLSKGKCTACCKDGQTARAKKPWMLEHLQNSDAVSCLTGMKMAKFTCHA